MMYMNTKMKSKYSTNMNTDTTARVAANKVQKKNVRRQFNRYQRKRAGRLRRGAWKGHPHDMIELGRSYRDGTGVRKNNFRSMKWFELGCRNGLMIGAVFSTLLEESLEEKERKKLKRRINRFLWLYDHHDLFGAIIFAAMFLFFILMNILPLIKG